MQEDLEKLGECVRIRNIKHYRLGLVQTVALTLFLKCWGVFCVVFFFFFAVRKAKHYAKQSHGSTQHRHADA